MTSKRYKVTGGFGKNIVPKNKLLQKIDTIKARTS